MRHKKYVKYSRELRTFNSRRTANEKRRKKQGNFLIGCVIFGDVDFLKENGE